MTPISRLRWSGMSILALLAATLVSESASAQQSPPPSNRDLVGEVTRCRDIGSDSARLACFDAAATSLAAAGEIAVVSREDVEQNQRRLFGFNVSTLNPFQTSGNPESLSSISATMASVRDLGRGEWLITLDDGSIWRKTDSVVPSFSTRRQYPVTVRRAALGSYLMKVGDNPPFRVRRE